MLRGRRQRLTEVRRPCPTPAASSSPPTRTPRARTPDLREITGEAPVVVLSDDDGASDRIEEFAAGDQRWMVAVRMVSEGVDVPRLAVGVYATSTSTPLFFAQAVGRFVRSRRRGETASVFLPERPDMLTRSRDRGGTRPRARQAEEAEDDPQWTPRRRCSRREP